MANTEVTPDFCLTLGRAAALTLAEPGGKFLLGRDTRRSGPMLQAALSAGIASCGVSVIDLGVLPTPAIAHASATFGLPAGVVSASHNPFEDNGIKFFSAGGRKLADATEQQLELRLAALEVDVNEVPKPVGAALGTVESDELASERYVSHVVGSVEAGALSGMSLVVDCANGASSTVARQCFESLGAEVTVINDRPDGFNINRNCGSTHMDELQRLVVASNATAGIAFDGDADRVLAVDQSGNVIDGDNIIAMLAVDAKNRDVLHENTIVVTVMSNLGLRLAMKDAGIDVRETKVGDRYVLDALEAGRLSLGGEQSGHVIIPAISSTGDGLLTAVQLMSVVARSDKPLGELSNATMRRLPQVLKNVRVTRSASLNDADPVWAVVAEVERELGETGRVLLRPSGTEPLIRVMVEAESADQADAACDRICRAVEAHFGTTLR